MCLGWRCSFGLVAWRAVRRGEGRRRWTVPGGRRRQGSRPVCPLTGIGEEMRGCSAAREGSRVAQRVCRRPEEVAARARNVTTTGGGEGVSPGGVAKKRGTATSVVPTRHGEDDAVT